MERKMKNAQERRNKQILDNLQALNTYVTKKFSRYRPQSHGAKGRAATVQKSESH